MCRKGRGRIDPRTARGTPGSELVPSSQDEEWCILSEFDEENMPEPSSRAHALDEPSRREKDEHEFKLKGVRGILGEGN